MITSPIVDVLLVGFAVLLVAGILREHMTATRMPKSEPLSWEQTVALLRAVRSCELLRVAGGSAHTARDEIQSNGYDMFQLIGGLEGLDRLQHNGTIIAALARRTQEFSLEGDPATIERIEEYASSLRRKALLWKMLRSLQLPRQAKHLYIRDIARTYCQMVSHLIMLYTITHISRRARLIAACNW